MSPTDDIEINKLIFHIVNYKDPIHLSEDELPLKNSIDTVDFFTRHIKNVLNDKIRKAAKFTNNGNDINIVCSDMLRDNSTFIEGSKFLAKRLYDVMKKKGAALSAGNLAVSLFRVVGTTEWQIVLLKFDPSIILIPKENASAAGKKYIDFHVEKEVLPTPRERLQKCAIIRPLPHEYRKSHDLWLIDRQSNDPLEVAKFFKEDFLGAELTLTDAQRTVEFYTAIMSSYNVLAEKYGFESTETNILDTALRNTLLNQTSVDVDDWIDTLNLKPADKYEIRKIVTKSVTDLQFDFDQSQTEQLTNKYRFRGDHGLLLEINENAFKRMITTDSDRYNNDGNLVITIRTENWKQIRK